MSIDSIDSNDESARPEASREGVRPNLDRNGLEVLERDECLALLRTATLGRVAVTAAALPRVFPITFRVSDDQILFRASPGTKLDAASNNNVVAFEADEFDPVSHTGWSVMVTGVASEVTDPDERGVADALQLPRWAPTEGGRIVAVSIELVSGRRIPDA
jgi:nitroimidazol reductase NimA-like FMN-containing flavoprotein (pyridoxamine 5'-phosphate oxidase superfamily)